MEPINIAIKKCKTAEQFLMRLYLASSFKWSLMFSRVSVSTRYLGILTCKEARLKSISLFGYSTTIPR